MEENKTKNISQNIFFYVPEKKINKYIMLIERINEWLI